MSLKLSTTAQILFVDTAGQTHGMVSSKNMTIVRIIITAIAKRLDR